MRIITIYFDPHKFPIQQTSIIKSPKQLIRRKIMTQFTTIGKSEPILILIAFSCWWMADICFCIQLRLPSVLADQSERYYNTSVFLNHEFIMRKRIIRQQLTDVQTKQIQNNVPIPNLQRVELWDFVLRSRRGFLNTIFAKRRSDMIYYCINNGFNILVNVQIRHSINIGLVKNTVLNLTSPNLD